MNRMDCRCICGGDGAYLRMRDGKEQYSCHESFACYNVNKKEQNAEELMPLWKCKIADYHPGEFYYVVVAAWNRRDAFMLMKDKTNLIGTVEPELTRMKSCFGKFKEAKILVA